jgi:hypothetical protein
MMNEELSMHRHKLIRVLTVLLGLASWDVFAGQGVSADIANIVTGWGQEGIYVYTKTAAQITLGGTCSASTSTFFIAASNTMRKDMEALLLTAIALGKPIGLYVDGCMNTVPIVQSVSVTN